MNKVIFKISRETKPNKLGAAIINSLVEGKKVDCYAIGRKAIENLIYAICIVSEKKTDTNIQVRFGSPTKSDTFILCVKVS